MSSTAIVTAVVRDGAMLLRAPVRGASWPIVSVPSPCPVGWMLPCALPTDAVRSDGARLVTTSTVSVIVRDVRDEAMRGTPRVAPRKTPELRESARRTGGRIRTLWPHQDLQHRLELRLRLGPLGVGLRARDDAGARDESCPASIEVCAAKRDAPRAVAAAIDPADRTGIAPAFERLDGSQHAQRGLAGRAPDRRCRVQRERKLERRRCRVLDVAANRRRVVAHGREPGH